MSPLLCVSPLKEGIHHWFSPAAQMSAQEDSVGGRQRCPQHSMLMPKRFFCHRLVSWIRQE